jgi:hypothetical protein
VSRKALICCWTLPPGTSKSNVRSIHYWPVYDFLRISRRISSKPVTPSEEQRSLRRIGISNIAYSASARQRISTAQAAQSVCLQHPRRCRTAKGVWNGPKMVVVCWSSSRHACDGGGQAEEASITWGTSIPRSAICVPQASNAPIQAVHVCGCTTSTLPAPWPRWEANGI